MKYSYFLRKKPLIKNLSGDNKIDEKNIINIIIFIKELFNTYFILEAFITR
jgi:hypothetical protein